MKKRIPVFLLYIAMPTFVSVLLSGCLGEKKISPEIVGTVSGLYHRQPVAVTKPKTISPPVNNRIYESVPRQWRPYSGIERKWKAIVIHHSATDKGSAAVFDKDHRQNRGWNGVGYDFVIGNGTNSGNGQVEVTDRWRQQKTGAHCRTDSTNWANRQAVGICLVGNFNNRRPSRQQIASLAKLTRFLSKRYSIGNSRIYGHNTTPKHSTKTDCPGKLFPMASLKSAL